MSEARWNELDEYVTDTLVGHDAVLEQALAASAAAGLPPIAVSPAQGKLLNLLARIHHASSVLELGTLGAYSTIWLARALPPGGRLVTLELDPDYAAVAAANIERAELAELVELRVGPGARCDALAHRGGRGAFRSDLHRRRQAEHAGVLRAGARALAARWGDSGRQRCAPRRPRRRVAGGPRGAGMRRLHERLRTEPRVSATTIQTVGLKGYDGFTLALVRGG